LKNGGMLCCGSHIILMQLRVGDGKMMRRSLRPSFPTHMAYTENYKIHKFIHFDGSSAPVGKMMRLPLPPSFPMAYAVNCKIHKFIQFDGSPAPVGKMMRLPLPPSFPMAYAVNCKIQKFIQFDGTSAPVEKMMRLRPLNTEGMGEGGGLISLVLNTLFR
jgi:hypothetical protein